MAVGLIILIPLSKIFLTKKGDKDRKGKKNKSLKELAGEYQLFQNLCRVQVESKSPLTGKTIQELSIPQRYNVGIMEVRRQSSSSRRHFFKTMSQEMAAADTVIQENDILYVLGDFTNVEHFAEENTLKLLDTHATEGTVEAKAKNWNLQKSVLPRLY